MIKITDLRVNYRRPEGGNIAALAGIDLHIAAGESVAVMGANGCGKTTLARCLNGLVRPTQGSVYVDGMDTRDDNLLVGIRKQVGMVFQNPENQIVSATVEREIAFGLENIGTEYEEMHRIVDDMLQMFDLEKYRTHPPHLLSGGEMQRLALAAVLAMHPRLVVFDEPTSLLDPAARASVLRYVHELQHSHRQHSDAPLTSFFVTQIPEEALQFERLLVLHEGKIIIDAPPVTAFEKVAELHEIGVAVPVEYEVKAYLENISAGRKTFAIADFAAFLKDEANHREKDESSGKS